LSSAELLHYIKRLTGKYQTPFGIAVWGFTAPGEAKEILVDSEGRLQIGGTVTAEVDFTDLKGVDNRTLTDLYNQMGTRASESTLSSILAQLDITLSALRDALKGAGNKDFTTLEADVESILAQIDVALSTRASESTLSAVDSKLGDIRGALGSVATDKMLTTPDNPPNLDVALSTRASESTLSSVLGQLDIKISELRDALKQSTIDTTVYTKSLADIWYQLTQTLAIHEQTPWNPPNLDVALSTRSSESTLSAFSGKFPSAVALGDALSNPTTTLIGSALLGWDSAGAVWERIKTDGGGRLLIWLG